jgi:hypothetical protein
MDDEGAISAWAAEYGLENDPAVLTVGHNFAYVAAQVSDVDDSMVHRILSKANPKFQWADAFGEGPVSLEAWKHLITFAVSCDGSSGHIQKIQTLSTDVQKFLMDYIQTYGDDYQHLIENDEPPSSMGRRARSHSRSVSRSRSPRRASRSEPGSAARLRKENQQLRDELDMSRQRRPRQSTRMSMALLDREEGDEMRRENDMLKAENMRLRKDQNRAKILDKENSDLEGQVDVLRAELQEQKAKNEKTKSLETKLEAAQGLKDKLRVETDKAADFQKRLKETEEQLTASRLTAQELPQCHEVIRDKSLEIATLRKAIQDMQDDLKGSSGTIEELQNSKSELQRELEGLRNARDVEVPDGRYVVEPLDELRELEDLRAENDKLREASLMPDNTSVKLKVELDTVSVMKDHFEKQCSQLQGELK